MIKKILTTKAHLVVLFLGVVNLITSEFNFGEMNEVIRTIGWGWDISAYIWYYDLYLNLLWVIVFPIGYWFLRKKYSLSFPLVFIQVIVIVLLIFSRMMDPELSVYLEIGNWILFFINIIAAFIITKKS